MKIFSPALGRINTKNRDGSEIRFVELAKIWSTQSKHLQILTISREKSVLEVQGLSNTSVSYILQKEIFNSESESTLNVVLTYLSRMIISLFVKYPRNIDVIYAPSDFLIDLLPALLCKFFNKNAKLIVCIFLIAPNPLRGYENQFSSNFRMPSIRSIIYYLTQQLGIFLIKIFNGTALVLNELDCQIISHKRVSVRRVSMGVGDEYFKGSPITESGLKYDGLFIGRLHPQKGVPDLFEIWARVVKEEPNARLAIIGGGSKEMVRFVSERISVLGLKNNIDFLGFIDGAKKINVLRSAKFLVMPSHYESFGMTILEAFAAKKPVCAYELPIYGKLFGDCPLYAKLNDFDEFAKNIIKLIQNSLVYDLQANMGLVVAKNFTWNLIADNELRIFNER